MQFEEIFPEVLTCDKIANDRILLYKEIGSLAMDVTLEEAALFNCASIEPLSTYWRGWR